MVEDAFVDGLHVFLVGRHQGVVRRGEVGQGGAKGLDVVEVAVEVVPTEAVLRHNVCVAVLHQLGQQGRAGEGLGVDVVLVQEPGQRLVGVQDVAVLVFAEEGAGLQGVEHGQTFRRVEQSCTQNGHLAFEHFGKVRDLDPSIGFDRHEVVRVVQTVLPLVGVDGMFEVLEGHVEESFQLGQGQGAFASGEILLVNLVAVVAGCGAQSVQDGAAVRVGNLA